MPITIGANGYPADLKTMPTNPKLNITKRSKTDACSANVPTEHNNNTIGSKYDLGIRKT